MPARRPLPLFLAALFLLLAAPLPLQAESFTIESFHSDIVVGDNGDVVVSERITVLFNRPRHGIYRDIPVRYTGDLGDKVKTPLSVLKVADEHERKRKYRSTPSGDALRIRIGHPRRFVEGRQVYVITYRVRNALHFLEDRDELAWNVNGSRWQVPMERVSANVILPGEGDLPVIDASCYTGTYGSVAAECDVGISPGGISFSSQRRLNVREGLTVAVGWPKDAVREPSALRRLLWACDLKRNWVFVVPFMALAALFMHWRAAGRDPEPYGVVTVMYDPPRYGEGELSPAEVGGLVDERLDSRDLTASIIGLAVKGYLAIEERKKEGFLLSSTDYHLSRIREADDRLTAFERTLMEKLFGGSSTGTLVSELKNRFYVHLDELRGTLFDQLVEKKYFRTSPGSVRTRYRFFGIAALFLGGGLAFLLSKTTSAFFDVRSVVSFALPGFFLLIAAAVMPAKTLLGARTARRIRGFEEFLQRAEKDRLERMKDLHLFERFLPYAIALNVSDRWAEAFAGIEQSPPPVVERIVGVGHRFPSPALQ